MSFNVLVICEDHRRDALIAKPLVERLLDEAGRPRSKVEVCRNPHLAGSGDCLKADRLEQVLRSHPMVHLFLLLVDRDGDSKRRETLDTFETLFTTRLTAGRWFLGEAAWQELEIFVLAGHPTCASWSWKAMREEVHLKETYFAQLVKEQGYDAGRFPHEGRKPLMQAALSNWKSIMSRCPEDLGALLERLSTSPIPAQ